MNTIKSSYYNDTVGYMKKEIHKEKDPNSKDIYE